LIRSVSKDVVSVGVLDWDRRLFDELIPLPKGTSYNSYIIKGSAKTALIDTVDPTKTGELLDNIREAGIKQIDYIISHHAEQDHSGSIPKVLEMFPAAKVVTNARCKSMLIDLMPSLKEDNFQVINDGDTISLGNKNLEFIFAPWVHWPETMCTYLKEDKVLFTCDFLGSHLAQSELFAVDEPMVYESAKRYYAEIMMPFRTSINTHLERLKEYQIEMIAPSHGPVYKKPKFIMDAYADWASDKVKNEVVVPFVSMHGSTRKMVDHFVGKLMEKGIIVKPFNLTQTDIGQLAEAMVDAATIVLGCPTVLVGPHPSIAHAAFLANALRPKTRFLSVIGSFGWGGKMLDQLSAMIPNLKVEVLSPVIIKGFPKEADIKALDVLAETIVTKHGTLGLK